MEPTPKSDIKEFQEVYDRLQKKVISNTKMITREDVNQDYMLHIAVKKWRELTPIFSRKANEQEDNTLVRVHVAPHIRGCMLGYSDVSFNLKYHDITKKDARWLGGYYIHKVDFKVGLKPNPKMVFDAKTTDEVWMITYNKDTVTFPTKIVGKIIPLRAIDTRNAKQKNRTYVECILEAYEPFNIDNDKEIQKGFYSYLLGERDATLTDLKELTKDQYEEMKKSVGVTLLNFEEPSFKNW